MTEELPALARALGCTVSAASLADLSVLMTAVESVDRHLDPLPSAPLRIQMAAQVMTRLRSPGATTVNLPAEVSSDLLRLSRVLARRALAASFCPLAAEMLANTEAMRNTASSSEYIRRAIREGELLVEASLLLLHEPAPALRLFLRRVAAAANLFDKLIDATRDYRSGELAIRPGLRFHCALITALLGGLPRALAAQRRPIAIASWAMRLTVAHVNFAPRILTHA
jgi:hypothetical protein